MMKRICLFVAVLAALVLLCGCSPDVILLNETSNGKIIECSKGDLVEIHLPGNPTTGFVWQQTRRPVNDVVVLKQDTFVTKDGNQKMVGVPGVFIFQYEITGSGKEGISLQYKRPWDPNSVMGKFEVLLNAN